MSQPKTTTQIEETLLSIHSAMPVLSTAIKETRVTDAVAILEVIQNLIWLQLRESDRAR